MGVPFKITGSLPHVLFWVKGPVTKELFVCSHGIGMCKASFSTFSSQLRSPLEVHEGEHIVGLLLHTF